MAALVLVDLDNLAWAWWREAEANSLPLPRATALSSSMLVPAGRRPAQLGWLERDDGGAAPAVAGAGDVAVLAFNTDTALRLSVGYLRRFVDRLRVLLALSGPCGIEVALTPRMPQTADAALTRLLTVATRPGHEGPFDRVWVISRDGGLRRALEQRLPGGARGWRRAERVPGLVVRFGTAGEPLKRGLSPTARPREDVVPEPLPEAWSVPIDTAGRALTAAHLPLGCSAEDDLPQLARLARDCPGLLSQIGPTSTSLRGVGRLSELVGADQRPVLVGACGPREGLEIHGAVRLSGVQPAAPLIEASVGSGAVHSAGLQATVSTLLPAAVPCQPEGAALAAFSGNRGALLDERLLASLAPGKLFGSANVRFRGTPSDDLVAQVEVRGPAVLPPAWWLRDEYGLHPSSVARVRGLARLLPQEVGPVAAGLVRDGASLGVMLASPHAAGGEVVVPSAIRSRTIGFGKGAQGRVAVLAGPEPLGVGPVRCTPIHMIDEAGLRLLYPGMAREDWRRLRQLPLVVPLVKSS